MMKTKKEVFTTPEIVAQWQATGNSLFLNELYKRFNSKVYYKCLSMAKNEDDALDLAQDVWVKVAQYIHKFKGNSSFSTWLYRITENRCIDFLKRQQRHYKMLDTKKNQLSEIDEGQQHISLKEQKELQVACLLESLKHLDADKRLLVELKYFDGLSIDEIGTKMDLSRGAVKMKLMRIRKNLLKNMPVNL